MPYTGLRHEWQEWTKWVLAHRCDCQTCRRVNVWVRTRRVSFNLFKWLFGTGYAAVNLPARTKGRLIQDSVDHWVTWEMQRFTVD